MPNASKEEKWLASSTSGPCVCSQLRRTARKVSALYDSALASSGLTVTQHALLVNIARTEQISVTALAARLGMDRTTLSRNLRPLEKALLIATVRSDDRRERLLRVSALGRRKLQRSYDLWESAQERFAFEAGVELLHKLRTVLQAAEEAADMANRR